METKIEPVTVRVSGTTVSPADKKKPAIRYAGNYKTCTYYHGTHERQCIIGDLCMRRDIALCPARSGWSQDINEPDVDFDVFCSMYPPGGN